jgi:hypothetical protein
LRALPAETWQPDGFRLWRCKIVPYLSSYERGLGGED